MWPGGLAPGWYFLSGTWTTDTKSTFDALAMRINVLGNGTVGGFVLQKKTRPLPQFAESGIGGIWSGKSSGDLFLRIMTTGNEVQVTFQGKWKKATYVGRFFQNARKYKEADKAVRGKFEYVLTRLQ